MGHPVHYNLVLPPGLGGLILSYIFLSTISSNLRGTGLSISMWSMLVVLKREDVIVQRDERISVSLYEEADILTLFSSIESNLICDDSI